MNEEQLLTKLEAFGADTAGAMERFIGDSELYAECLGCFAADEGFLTLGQALETGNIKRAFETSHMLKGVSANLGLNPMTDAISALVEPLRRGSQEDLTKQYAAVLELLENFKLILNATA